jgi:hypothetical protein
MSAVAADPGPIPPVDAFVIGEPAGRVETFLLPIARLPDLLMERDDDRPSILASIAKLAAITAGIGVCLAGAALSVTSFALRLFR